MKKRDAKKEAEISLCLMSYIVSVVCDVVADVLYKLSIMWIEILADFKAVVFSEGLHDTWESI